MITLAVGSVVLAVATPMVTKQIKYNNFSDQQVSVIQSQIAKVDTNIKEVEDIIKNDIAVEIEKLKKKPKEVPTGSIMFFDLDSCPSGWEPLVKKYSYASNLFLEICLAQEVF